LVFLIPAVAVFSAMLILHPQISRRLNHLLKNFATASVRVRTCNFS
jgi:hypothetical protein